MPKRPSESTHEQQAQIEALASLPDDEIDTTDIPETLDWSGGRRGVFHQGMKRQRPLREDVQRSKQPRPDA